MSGTLYGVGVGPGDPELMTLKAVRTIAECDVIAVPVTGSAERVAEQIAAQVVSGMEQKRILELAMPMTRDQSTLNAYHDQAAQQIYELLEQGQDVAFLTLGDPTIYSTYMYVHKRVGAMGGRTAIVSGIPSFCAVAARLNTSLTEGGQPLHVIPASYPNTQEGIALDGTKVLMKAGKAFGEVKLWIAQSGQQASMVSRCGMSGEQAFEDIADADESASYFSVILVKDEGAV